MARAARGAREVEGRVLPVEDASEAGLLRLKARTILLRWALASLAWAALALAVRGWLASP
ncbi:MAG: hypothetical protein ACKOSS_10555 [Planctomycetia bacterium]